MPRSKSFTSKLDGLVGKVDPKFPQIGVRRTQLRILHRAMHDEVTGDQIEPSEAAIRHASNVVGEDLVRDFVNGHRYPHKIEG